MSDRVDGPDAPRPDRDRPPTPTPFTEREYSIVGRTPGQKISRALLLVGLLLMLWVVFQLIKAFG